MPDESAVVLAEREVKSIVEVAVKTAVTTVVPEPAMKPLVEITGPEKVVFAIELSSHASSVRLSACRQPGRLSDAPEYPRKFDYT
jgi:hypothetical protein